MGKKVEYEGIDLKRYTQLRVPKRGQRLRKADDVDMTNVDGAFYFPKPKKGFPSHTLVKTELNGSDTANLDAPAMDPDKQGWQFTFIMNNLLESANGLPSEDRVGPHYVFTETEFINSGKRRPHD